MREAKLHTTWVDVDEEHEAAVQSLRAGAADAPRVPARLRAVPGARSPRRATRAALGQLLLKLTVPGVPDIYQGDELLCLSLVDPDNRRAVDWDERAARRWTIRRRSCR